MTTGKAKSLIAMLLMLCATAAHAAGRQQPTAATARVRIVYNGDMTSLLAQLAKSFDTTIGFEVDPRQQKSVINLNLRDATLEDILNAVVQSAPEYHWSNQEGSVAVSPKEAACPLLDTGVHNFRFDGTGWAQATRALTRLPAVQARINAMGLSLSETVEVAASKDAGSFSLNLDGVTVRRALDEMARQSGSNFWVFRRYGQDYQFFSINNSAK